MCTVGGDDAMIPRRYVCCRTPEPPDINGRLDQPMWQRAAWTEDFVDIEGSARPAPRFRTRAKLLWDDACLYVGAEIEEPHVWATLTEHDSVIFHDPDFEVFIDPDGDNHSYFEIEINALNTEWDLRLVKPYRDGGPALNEWEIPGLRTAVHVDGTINDPRDTDRGWSVALAFPWTAFAEHAGCRCPPVSGDTWRINFSRVEWEVAVVDGRYVKTPGKPEDNWVWSPQGAVDMHRPETWGYVQFTDAEPDRAEFRPDPAEPVRMWLMAVYHAQRAHHDRHGRWSASIEALGLPAPPTDATARSARLALSPDGWTASVDTGQETWSVRQDSRLWREPSL
ncbi:MAG: hypothetical protein GX446_08400 [Chthonomonadales bacterium]|nr:hypothetical protein [Chthonomonadales bacterium]